MEMESKQHPWAVTTDSASVIRSEDIKQKFRACDDKDPRVHKKEKGPKTREKEADPTKPQFERDEGHLSKVDKFQKSKLFDVQTRERLDRETIKLKPYDVSQIRSDFTIVYFGKRRG